MNSEEIESYIKAGQIAQKVMEFVKQITTKDTLILQIAEQIEQKIKELGAQPAFPTNISINEIAAHYTPTFEDKTLANGLLKIDFGVSINGYVADNAISFDLTPEKQFQEIIDLNNLVLKNAINKIKPDTKANEIGKAIQDTLEKYNKENNTSISIIKNLSGHSLDKDTIHAGLTIQNYKNNNTTKLNNIAIAIEPFLTTGQGLIYESTASEIFMLKHNNQTKQIRDKDARTLLKFIKDNYQTKPFCKRWLHKQDFKKLDFSLKLLEKENILHNFPVLIEKSKQPVSQAEHTVLIMSEEASVITRDEE